MAGKLAELVTLVLLATAVPRLLGPHRYGRFSVPLTIVTLGSLALSLGGPTVVARFVPAAPPDQRLAVARAIGARLARGRVVQMVAVAAVASLAVIVDTDRFPPLLTSLVVLSLCLSVGATLALQVPLGLGRTGPWVARYPLQNVVLVVAVVLLRDVGDGTGPVVAIAISAAAAGGFAAVVLGPIVAVPVDPVDLPEGALRFGAYHALGAALVQVAQRGGVVAVAVLGGSSSEVGYTALALGLALGVTYAVLQAFTVSLPHLADGEVTPVAEAERVLTRLATGLLLVLVPAMASAALLADRWVPVVFGADYRAAVDAFAPALALVVLAPANSLIVQLAALRLQAQVTAAHGMGAAAAFLVGSLIMIPTWAAVGATGAALAAGGASAVIGVILLPESVDRRLVSGSLVAAAFVCLVGVV